MPKCIAPLIGTAGWSIPSHDRANFPGEGSHLERYSARLPAVEINSSFYRPHRRETYARWAASVPADFRFSVKVPRTITHESRLADSAGLLGAFLDGVGGLRDRLGVLLVQLPPGLGFEGTVASTFFDALRGQFDGAVVCEPRHASWFTGPADELLVASRVARVAADPPGVPAAADPGGWNGLVYYRLHGSPKTYYSSYGQESLGPLAAKISASVGKGVLTWCIFDNTAAGAATTNALATLDRCADPRERT